MSPQALAVDLEAARQARDGEGGTLRQAFDAFRRFVDADVPAFLKLQAKLDCLQGVTGHAPDDAGFCPRCSGVARWNGGRPRCEGEGAGAACGDIGPALMNWLTGEGRPSEGLQLVDFEELLTLPNMSWVIEGMIPTGLSVLYGASGAFKSFMALDWALCVATGTPWFGHPVKASGVVYVATEGRGGLKHRVEAWWLAHGKPDMSRMRWLPEVVDLRNQVAIERGRQALASLPAWPGLVVVDTLARSMPGGDENAVKDLGEFLTGTDALRGDGSALVVHHTGKDGESERGSTALRGAADLMVKAKRTGRSLRLDLSCDKLRDAEEWQPHAVRLVAKAGSLVPELVTKTEDGLEERVLAFVQEHPPASKRSVRVAVTGGNPAIDEALDRLQRAGSIDLSDAGYVPCPEDRGTPGHTPSAGSGGGVPPSGGCVPRRGTPERGTPRPVPETPCPGTGEPGGTGDPSASPERPLDVSCRCKRPARSPRADGPAVCQVCKKPMAGISTDTMEVST